MPFSLNIKRLARNCHRPSSSTRRRVMSAPLDDPLTPELRDILNNLAAALFGLDAWIKEPGKYVPPGQNLPWRAAGHSFTPADLAVIPFFENLLRESSG